MADPLLGPGTVLAGRFRLEDLLDENDGARFWKATDQVLARSVAVHVVADSDPRAAALLDAARSSALVSDVHLLRVLDAAAADGLVYVVNEWGSGVSLDRLVAEGPLSARRAAWVVKEVAEGIATAHRNGVAHGRLLPENVLISETGSVKLIGFVIEAVLRSSGAHRRVTDGRSLTAREADVVNLAALLYAALVGRWPGTEGSTVPVAPTEHGRALRPRRVRAGVPRPLDAICEQVLNVEAHPGAAPIETAHEIHAALSDFIGDPGGSSSWGLPAYEPTMLLDRSAADGAPGADRGEWGGPAAATAATPATASTGATGATGATDEEDATEVRDRPATTAPAGDPEATQVGDPEATQAGVPSFLDDTGSPGWYPTPAPPGRAQPPEPSDRPLFADGPTTSTSTPTSATASGRAGGPPGSSRSSGPLRTRPGQRSTGAGNGPVPPVWGPDADQPPPAAASGWRPESRDDDLPGRSWLRLAVVLGGAVVAVLVTVFALDLGRGPGTPSTAPSSPRPSATKPAGGVRVPIASVRDFDPQGDPPEENPALAPLAVDGKPGTAWTTVTYRGNPHLGGLKSGVGLLVDLGRSATVGEVRLTLVGRPTSLQVLAAPGASSAPASTDGLPVVASSTAAGTQVDLKAARTVHTRWLVVWLTSLPPAPGGYQGRVAEISVRS